MLTASTENASVQFNVGVKGTVGNTTIYLAGDSHMMNYGENYYPQQGWGYYFSDYFGDRVITVNAAVGGESAKTFYLKPNRFTESIYDKLVPGDYVFISFGTNDAAKINSDFTYTDKNGESHTLKIGSDTTEYVEYLDKLCDDVKSKGAHPVLVTIANNGEKRNSFSAYVAAMRTYASENNIDLIDMNQMYNDYINQVKGLSITSAEQQSGEAVPEYVKEEMNLYNMVERGIITAEKLASHPNTSFGSSGTGTDLFHFSENGAQIMARWVAQGVYKSTSGVCASLKELMVADNIKPTIYTAGDSLMFDWTRFGEAWYPYQGWGTYLKDYLTGAKVENTAFSGETTASFYYMSPYMPEIRKKLNHGDYLIVSLGANDKIYSLSDQTITGYDGNQYKKGATYDEYKANLKMYIEDMRKRNVNIVFATSPSYDNYNFGSDYFNRMKEVANENNVPVIDVRAAHLEYIDSLYPGLVKGDAYPKQYLIDMHMTRDSLRTNYNFTDQQIEDHPSNMVTSEKDDGTHFNINGAKIIARLAMETLRDSTDPRLAEMKAFLNPNAFVEKAPESTDLAITDVLFDKENSVDGYMGASISVVLPKGKLSKMKWVFVTPEERLYSKTIVETPVVKVEGAVKFGIVIKNGVTDEQGNISGVKNITDVDAIFMIDGSNVFTNLLDKANYGIQGGNE